MDYGHNLNYLIAKHALGPFAGVVHACIDFVVLGRSSTYKEKILTEIVFIIRFKR